jgi:polyphenol oxidase
LKRSPLLADIIQTAGLSGVPHGFLGRQGGVSRGIYEGLNTGFGSHDDQVAVIENRRRAGNAILAGAPIITAHQIHSADVISVDMSFENGKRPRGDALVTDRPGLLLGILTADCVPVLLADADAGVIGAAHAGWKGALAGVTDAVIMAMEKLGARRMRIIAAIGPCIGRASYEVSDSFALHFRQSDPDNDRFFMDGKAGHHYFDIEAYVAHRIASADIRHIDIVGLDTVTNTDRFFSYRRATLMGEKDYGRQIALIGLAPS